MRTDAENAQGKLIEELAEFRRLSEWIGDDDAVTACLSVLRDSAYTLRPPDEG